MDQILTPLENLSVIYRKHVSEYCMSYIFHQSYQLSSNKKGIDTKLTNLINVNKIYVEFKKKKEIYNTWVRRNIAMLPTTIPILPGLTPVCSTKVCPIPVVTVRFWSERIQLSQLSRYGDKYYNHTERWYSECLIRARVTTGTPCRSITVGEAAEVRIVRG